VLPPTPMRSFSFSKDWRVPRGIRTTRAVLVLLFMGILLWAGIMKNAVHSVTPFGWIIISLCSYFTKFTQTGEHRNQSSPHPTRLTTRRMAGPRFVPPCDDRTEI